MGIIVPIQIDALKSKDALLVSSYLFSVIHRCRPLVQVKRSLVMEQKTQMIKPTIKNITQ